MVTVPEESQNEEGVSPSQLARKLVAALGMQGVFDFSVDPKKWGKGLEGAVSFGVKKGVEFNFREMLFSHLYESANRNGILYRIEDNGGIRYRTSFKTVKEAREYFGDFVRDPKEKRVYEGMARAFLRSFKNSAAKKQKWSMTVDKSRRLK